MPLKLLTVPRTPFRILGKSVVSYKCMEGPNKGKPGVCPVGGGSKPASDDGSGEGEEVGDEFAEEMIEEMESITSLKEFKEWKEMLFEDYGPDDLSDELKEAIKQKEASFKKPKKEKKPVEEKPKAEEPKTEEPKPEPAKVEQKPEAPKPAPSPVSNVEGDAVFRKSVGKPVKIKQVKAPTFVKVQGQELKNAIGGSEAGKALAEYTTEDGYTLVNKSMRKCPPNYECVSGKAKKLMDGVNEALAKAKPFSEPVTVFRGVQLDDATLKKTLALYDQAKQSGGSLTLPGVLSTTVSPNQALKFGGYMRGSNLPAGTLMYQIRAKTGAYAADFTKHPEEEEIVKSAATQYRVVDVVDTDYVEDTGGKLKAKTIYLEEI